MVDSPRTTALAIIVGGRELLTEEEVAVLTEQGYDLNDVAVTESGEMPGSGRGICIISGGERERMAERAAQMMIHCRPDDMYKVERMYEPDRPVKDWKNRERQRPWKSKRRR